MIYMQCKCGKSTYTHSGLPPKECQGCEICGTTYATNPMDHKALVLHHPEPRYDERTGERKNYDVCMHCHSRIARKVEKR